MIDFLRVRPLGCLLAMAALLIGCNLFNPSGTGPSRDDDADYWIEEGQQAIQAKRFEEAYQDFSKALKLDSSKSLAWNGLAKSKFANANFDFAKMVTLGQSISSATKEAALDTLIALGDTGLTDIYHPLMQVASIYSRFLSRDSAKRTDGVFPARLVRFEVDAILNYMVYFYLMDGNRDTVISHAELSALKLMNLATGSIQVDPQTLGTQGGFDSATGALPDTTRDKINTIFGNVANMVEDTALFNRVTGSTNDGSATGSMNQDAKDFLTKLGTGTRMYMVNDSLDNDGDGCVSEEIYGDSLDNDGDSLKDEDGRIGLSRGKPKADSLAMLTPDNGILADGLKVENDSLVFIPGKDDFLPGILQAPRGVMVWEDTSGLLKGYKGLRWVRWDDPGSGNDTIYQRVRRENGIGDSLKTPKEIRDYLAGKGKSYEEFRTLAISEVRKKVLAVKAGVQRVLMGRKLVGGCWDHVAIP